MYSLMRRLEEPIYLRYVLLSNDTSYMQWMGCLTSAIDRQFHVAKVLNHKLEATYMYILYSAINHPRAVSKERRYVRR